MNTRVVICFGLLATLACGACTQQSDDFLEAQALIVAEGKKSVPQLLEEYRTEIDNNPDRPQGYVLPATLYDRPESDELFRKALEIDSDFAPARIAYSRYLLRTGKPQSARVIIYPALFGRGDEAKVRLCAIEAAARLGDRARACEFAGADPALRIGVIQALLDAGRNGDAQKAWEELQLDGYKTPEATAVTWPKDLWRRADTIRLWPRTLDTATRNS